MKFQGFVTAIVGMPKRAPLAAGYLVMVMGAALVGTSVASASTETGVVLECSSGKVSMRDRVNVTLTKNANGQLTAEVESLKGNRGQVARRGVSEKHGPAGTLYKSESGDFQLKVEASSAGGRLPKVQGTKTAQVTFKKGSAGEVKANVNCRKSSGLFEQI
jgi:hypothetical protein